MKNKTHSDVKVIWIADEKLFRVFDLGVAIHGSEFVCFLDTFICYWVWGKRLKVTKNFVYPGQQRRFLRNFWWRWLVASLCYRHRSTPPHARKKKKDLWYPTSVGRCSRSIRVVVPKPITMYLDKVISTSERGITGTVNKGEVDVVH